MEGSGRFKYRLTNISDTELTQPIDFTIIPPGTVVAPPLLGPDGQPQIDSVTGQPMTDNPLTPVDPNGFDPASTFRAYDPKNLTVALGQDDPLTTQAFRLIFGSQIVTDENGQLNLKAILDEAGNPVGGLKPGAENAIDFRLNLAPASTEVPDLLPRPEVAQFVMVEKFFEPVRTGGRPPGGPPAGGGDTQIPEPLSVLLWSGVAGLSLMRVRLFRRHRAISTAC
jgi:hypothetical protein